MGLNRVRVIPGRGCVCGVVGHAVQDLPVLGVEVRAYRRTRGECVTGEGGSPVVVMRSAGLCVYPE